MPDSRTARKRKDGCQELSVNLEDGPGALEELRRRGCPNGVVRVSVEEVHSLVLKSHLKDLVRSPLRDNPYHGDILFPGNLPEFRIRQVASALALAAVMATPPPPGSA